MDTSSEREGPAPPTESQSTTARGLWWVYSAIVLAVGFGRTGQKILTDTGGPPSRYGPALGASVVASAVLISLSGRALGPRWAWIVVFALLVHGSLGLMFLEAVILFGGSAPAPIHALVVGGVVLALPAQVRLWRHAIGGRNAWRADGVTGAAVGG